MRAAIYLRVSTEEQAKHGYSLAEQKEACRRRAESLGARQVLEFADEGVTGATLDRPALAALRDAVKEGQIDIVVVRDPDRLSRKLAHQLLLTEEFEKAGVRLEFLDFEWKDTPEGRMFYAIRGAIAEFEKEKIRERMTRGKMQKARQGGIPIGFYAYGYIYDPDTDKVTPHPEEADIVRNMFRWFATEDIGVNGVARRLNELAVSTKTKKGKWHRMVVRQMLTNPVYIGMWRYRGLYIPVPALVDIETWEKVQEKLKEARRLWAGKSQHDYLLSGLLTCAECGNTMTGVYARWWGKRERRYTCRKPYEGASREGCRPIKMVLARVIEKAVWEQIRSWLNDPEELAREAMEAMPQVNELRRELETVEKRIAEVEKGREAVLDVLASGLFELDAKTKIKLEELKRRKIRLEQRRKEILAVLEGAEGTFSRIEDLRTLARNVLSRLDELEFQEKKALVRELVAQVIVAGRGKSGGNGLRDISITVVAKIPDSEKSISSTSFTKNIR